MLKEYLQNLQGVEFTASFLLLLFFALFLGILYKTFQMTKDEVEFAGNMPLDEK
jgi:hypothetical protein